MTQKRIIILDRIDLPSDNSYRVAFWAVVPSARVSFYANASATSAYKDIAAGDLTALQNGSIVEKVATFSFTAGTSLANVEAALQTQWTNYQNSISAVNPYVRYGTFWDDTPGWTAGGYA